MLRWLLASQHEVPERDVVIEDVMALHGAGTKGRMWRVYYWLKGRLCRCRVAEDLVSNE